MCKVCILTDSSVQFTTPTFPGHELVSVIPLRIRINQRLYKDGSDLALDKLPLSMRNGPDPLILPPDADEFTQKLESLARDYEHILIILLSASLNPAISSVYALCHSMHSSASIHIIDSQTTSIGQGLIVQAAAEAAQEQQNIIEVKRMLHGLIPRVYTIYCTQSLTYLRHSGQLDPAQALVGEMMGVTPFFLMENGWLVPVQKARNARNMVDIFDEFILEFGEMQHIAMLQGMPPYPGEIRTLRERIHQEFPETPYSEHLMGVSVAIMLGPRSLGLVTLIK